VNRAVARRALSTTPPRLETDSDLIARYVEDAAHYPGGRARAVVRPSNIDEVAAAVQAAPALLVVGVQSSLTGGATPADDVVLSTERLTSVSVTTTQVTAGAGVTLEALQRELSTYNVWLPPVPTFLGATAGGAASTNAAGAATFKYGTMRDWIDGLTVVLASGDVLELRRGEVRASEAGVFEIEADGGVRQVAIPHLTMPAVPKCSAGYCSRPNMDLVDLFIGSEGTLGAIVDVTFRVAARPAGVCWALVPMSSETTAIALVDALRRAASDTWRTRDPQGVDVAAIEHLDGRVLAILKEDGVDRRLNVTLSPQTEVVLLVQLELSAASAAGDLWGDLADGGLSGDSPLARFCRLLEQFGAFDDTEIVPPASASRRIALAEFREAAPTAVNRRVALAKAQVDDRIHKTAADAIVPFECFGDMMRMCRSLFRSRNIDLAVWGHISDGNVHPNVVPRSYADVETGKALMIELGREVIAMGGSPLAEHGVGRSPMKQQLLQMLYGDTGIASMRRVKQALDPDCKFARGVLFTPLPA